MKKGTIILGVLALLVSNVSVAANQKTEVKNQTEFSFYSQSSLHFAISKGDMEGVKKLVEYGADVNKMVKDMSPLMVAARYNQFEIIKFLLAHGAKASEKNEKGFTALKYAETFAAVESISILKAVI